MVVRILSTHCFRAIWAFSVQSSASVGFKGLLGVSGAHLTAASDSWACRDKGRICRGLPVVSHLLATLRQSPLPLRYPGLARGPA
jgi:hypothetical protein